MPFDLLVDARGTAAVRVDRREPGLQEAGLRAYTHLAASAGDRAGEKVYPRASQPQRHPAGFGGDDQGATVPRYQGHHPRHRQVVEHDARPQRTAIGIVLALLHPCPVTAGLLRVIRELRNGRVRLFNALQTRDVDTSNRFTCVTKISDLFEYYNTFLLVKNILIFKIFKRIL